jgi:hypothetical protein
MLVQSGVFYPAFTAPATPTFGVGTDLTVPSLGAARKGAGLVADRVPRGTGLAEARLELL